MATKRKLCEACRTVTIVRKVAFKGDEPEKPSYAWLCSICVEKIKNNYHSAQPEEV